MHGSSQNPSHDGTAGAGSRGGTKLTWIVVALCAVVAGFLLLQIGLMQYGRDQAIYAVVADVMVDGGAPYKDAWDFKPPGIFAVYALGRALIGEPMYAVRILEVLALLSMVAAFAILSRRSPGGWVTGVVAGVLALVYHVNLGFWHTAQPESFGGPLIAWAVVLALYEPQGAGARAGWRERIAWAGCAALFAAAALMKPPLGGGIVFAFVVVLRRIWRQSPPGLRRARLAAATVSFAFGGFAVVGTAMLALIASGAWSDFRYTLFTYVPHYTQIEFSFAEFPKLLERTFSRWPAGDHKFIWIGALALLLPRWLERKEKEAFVILGGSVVLQVIGVALQAKYIIYHYGALLPLTALLLVWGYARILRFPRWRWAALVVVIAGIQFVASRHEMIDACRGRWAALVDPARRVELNDELHSIADVNARANRETAAWIAANTPQDEPIFVWGFEPIIYLQSGRRPASRYIYNVPQRSQWEQTANRAQLMTDLARTPPAVVVTVKRDALPWVTGNDLDSVDALAEFPELAHLIAVDYVAEKTLEDLTVYRRTDLRPTRADAGRDQSPAGGIAPDRRHVLILTFDTLRADYLSNRGYDLPTTPTIDELYAEATVFTRALTPIPRTTPALASMLTGRYPHGTGVRTLVDRLPDDVPTLQEVARDAGYRTVAVVSNHVLVPETGLDRGWDIYDFAGDARGAVQTNAAVRRNLGGVSPETPLLLWVHYIDPHFPYSPQPATIAAFAPRYQGRFRHRFGEDDAWARSEEWAGDLSKPQAVYENPLPSEVNEHIRRLYAADIRDTDDAAGELLAWLRGTFGPDWTIVFGSDHGESLGEHDYYFDHGDYVFEAGSRIPLAFVFPPGSTYHGSGLAEDWVSLVDVTPTLVDALGLKVPDDMRAEFEGVSLTPVLLGSAVPERVLFAECGHSYFPEFVRDRVRFDVSGRFRAVWEGDWKLIWTPFRESGGEYRLYNIAQDPHERTDLAAKHPDKVDALSELLGSWLRDGDSAPVALELDAAEKQRLKSLGYIGG